jgi:multiple sugar transport system ATP-binding protein
MMAGLEEITKGELNIGDKLVNDVAPKDRDIAMVFQNYALYPHMSVYDNMAFSLKLRKKSKKEIKQRVEEATEILDITHLLDRKPKALSGGQRQRVARGLAIVREPKVFLLDEPLSNLDAKLHKKLQTTFIYVTHDQTEAMTMGDRIVTMKDGFIQQVDTPQNLYERPCNMFVTGFIGSPQMNFINARLVQSEGQLVAEFGSGEGKGSVKLSASKCRDNALEGYIGKEVVWGIRPENIHDDEIFLAAGADGVIDAYVDLTELLGSETYLYLNVADSSLTARVAPRTTAQSGETIKVAFDVNKIHLFDKETQQAILH